eukprot:4232704-Amphidinium_carterae.1
MAMALCINVQCTELHRDRVRGLGGALKHPRLGNSGRRGKVYKPLWRFSKWVVQSRGSTNTRIE